MNLPGMNLITTLCPHCLTAVKDRHPSCDQCGAPSALGERVRMTLQEYFDLPKHPCPRCGAHKPERAPTCMACKYRAGPGRPPAALPPALLAWLTTISFEESEVVAVVPAPLPVETVGARLAAAGLSGSLLAPDGPGRRGASWQLRGAVRVPGVREPLAFTAEGERRGWPLDVWFEPLRPEHVRRCFEPVVHPPQAFVIGTSFAAGASFAAQFAGASAAGFDDIAQAALLGYWVQMLVTRVIAPEAYYTIDLSGGVVPPKGFEPRTPDDAYSTFVTREGGRAWVHTEGLPRWGAPDLELFDVPEAQIGAATAFLRAIVAALAGRRLPPPGEPIRLADGRLITYAPFDGRLDATPGRRQADRDRYPHGVITPQLKPSG
ncbi:MAG: zinc ribbon domain-containing protein [Polyangiaceae bacterium]|jgi:hypothetical protein|nr:zinc ribbon domain-containing protein [Polyangiaceae bacterium]